jgi:hypothetical protein
MDCVQFLSKSCYGSFCFLASHTYAAKKHHFLGHGKRGYFIKLIQTTFCSHNISLKSFPNKKSGNMTVKYFTTICTYIQTYFIIWIFHVANLILP